MLIIGVTGGIGSGKSAATHEFTKLGIEVVDADVAARTIVEKGQSALQQIAQQFGNNILLPNGELDRAALRKVIFEFPEQRKWLETLTHPLIRNEIINGLKSAKSPYVILASPLLIESGQYHLVTRTLVIDVPVEVQIKRTCQRDNNDPEQVQAIIEAQISRDERLKKADDVIENQYNLNHLHEEILKLHQAYLKMI
ncbi:MAG: dephospho-CoA kinase [Bermanella sp.]|jgi:dephospho-CoA kinase